MGSSGLMYAQDLAVVVLGAFTFFQPFQCMTLAGVCRHKQAIFPNPETRKDAGIVADVMPLTGQAQMLRYQWQRSLLGSLVCVGWRRREI